MSVLDPALNPASGRAPRLDPRAAPSRRRRPRRRGPIRHLLGRMSVERRDLWVIAAVLLAAAALLRFTTVLDRWFDRFNAPSPDAIQRMEALSGDGR